MGERFRRLVLCGMPRSGTTLMSALLDAQQDCHFITDYVASFWEAARHLDVSWTQTLTITERRTALAIVRDQFLRFRHPIIVTIDDFESCDELHRAVMADLVADGRGDADTGGGGMRVVGHKRVCSVAEVEQMLDESDIECLVMMRDPRDAALSFFHRIGGGVERYVDDWLAMAELLQRRAEHPRLHVVHYERFVRDPKASMSGLEHALDLAIDAAAGRFGFRTGASEDAIEWRQNSVFEDVAERFDETPVDRWRTHLDSPVVRYAGILCQDAMQPMGYEPLPDPGLRERLRIRRHATISRTIRALRARADDASEQLLRRFAPPIEHTE